MKDNDIGNERVEKYLPLVGHVIKRFKRGWDFRHEVWEDLYGVAYCALVKAEREFDSERGCKFKTHAYTYIKNAVMSEIRNMGKWFRNPGSLDTGWGDEEGRYGFVESRAVSSHRQVERKEICGILERVFGRLSYDDVDIILGHYLFAGDFLLLLVVQFLNFICF